MADHYESLSKSQLVSLLRKKEANKKLGLVWERDEIEADAAIDANFVACSIDQSLSDGAPPWRNLVIEGDNFDALRWLRMTHASRIKCIYIDPPYNTGSRDWVYNDHYIDPSDRYRHSTWLEFLYRRLTLARDLLSRDGVILVSINDDNRAKLELMMDEALPGMRIGSMVWRTRIGGNEGSDAFFSVNHESVLIYGNKDFRFAGSEKSFSMYHSDPNNPDGDWRKSDLTVAVGYESPRAGKAYYPLQDPKTGIWYPCNPDRVWVFASREHSGETGRIKTKFMEDWIAEGRIIFPDDPKPKCWDTKEELVAAIRAREVPMSGRAPLLRESLPDLDFWVGKQVGFGVPGFKRFKRELRNPTQPLSSWVVPRAEEDTVLPDANIIVAGTNDEGAKAIKEVFGSKAFDYAKPPSLIRELVRQATAPNDVVLDFFAGSATTAQAVIELNSDDGGERSFIMVSSTEATVEDPGKNICRDVTAERIRLLNATATGKYANLSAEFAYLKTREIDFDALNSELEPDEAWSALEAMHGLPLTFYDAGAGWNEHTTEEITLILADRTDDALIVRLRELAARRTNAFVYSWAPGQLTAAIGPVDFEIRQVRETLVKRFQQ